MPPPLLRPFAQRLVNPGELSRENVANNQQLADVLLASSMRPQPIEHWTQGMAQLMNAMNSQLYRQRATRGSGALKAQEAQQLGALMQSLQLDPSQAALFSSLPPETQMGIGTQVAAQRLMPQAGEQFTLGAGQTRFGPDGRPIASLPESPEDPTRPDQVNIRIAGPNGESDIFAANIDPFTGVATARGRTFQPGEYQRVSTSITGTPDQVFPTEGERRVSLGSRLLLSLEEAANDALTNNPDFDPTALPEARGETPLVGNVLASPGWQQYRSAADEWTANMVYLRSGTTARQDEKDSAFQNFWYRVGDDPQTLPFKRRLRLEAMREAYIAGARANRIGSDEADAVLADIDRQLATLQQSGAPQAPRVIDFNDL